MQLPAAVSRVQARQETAAVLIRIAVQKTRIAVGMVRTVSRTAVTTVTGTVREEARAAAVLIRIAVGMVRIVSRTAATTVTGMVREEVRAAAAVSQDSRILMQYLWRR